MASVGTRAMQSAPPDRAERHSPKRARHSGAAESLDALDRRLLDEYQRDFPLCERPYSAVASRLGCDEATVIARLRRLEKDGYLSRIGPVFRPRCLGASTLAAMAVPPVRLQSVADIVSGYVEVNHNYEREHEFNLWFVVTAKDEQAVAAVLADIRERTGLEIMDLPLVDEFHIDLGFPLWPT